MVLNPKESGQFIANHAKHVKILHSGIEKLGNMLIEKVETGELKVGNFSQNDYHPKSEDPWAIDWLFVVDTLNFCFWHKEGESGWEVDGKTGYFALCNAINRANKEKVDILNPKYYSVITENQLSTVLRSDNNIPVPLLEERLKCLHEVGTCLIEKFGGSFKNCVKEANGSAIKLLDIIQRNFICFQDEVEYESQKLSIYKRAQILIGDIWSCYKNEGLGYFYDIDEITVFADYRVPQSLLYYNVFEYSPELMKLLRNNTILDYGSKMEVEIRGCCIHAGTLLKDFVNSKIQPEQSVNCIVIDHFLWDFRRAHASKILGKQLPFHKTFSIYY